MELLKFWADWCGPCDQQDTILEEYDLTPVRSIDVDTEVHLANKYSVRSLPSLILVDDSGSVLDRWVGVTSIDEIESVVEQNS